MIFLVFKPLPKNFTPENSNKNWYMIKISGIITIINKKLDITPEERVLSGIICYDNSYF
jgi:hypothetical protein